MAGQSQLIEFSPKNIWRVTWVVVGAAACVALLRFVFEDGGSMIFTVLISWFVAMAMEPAVSRLAKHMKRGLATLITMVTFAVCCLIFFVAFGALMVEQVVQAVSALPEIAASVIDWANHTFGLTLDTKQLMDSANINPDSIKSHAASLGTTVLSIVGSVIASFFNLFVVGLLTFYISADQPRLRRWLAGLFPENIQRVFITAWDLITEKTGAYMGARVILAAINSATTGIVFAIIGMPYWLALALWTGVVAQFVPTIGTYIAIILPVIVGLMSGEPWIGVAALVWAIAYQQVENLTIEPKISAKAVNVHPAGAFASVLLGASLFGVSGAFFAIPVTAMLLAMLDLYRKRYTLITEVGESGDEIDMNVVEEALENASTGPKVTLVEGDKE